MSYYPYSFNHAWPHEPLTVSVAIASSVETELIDINEANAFLKEPNNANEDLILSLIKAARQYAEKRTGRSVARKDYILSLNRFPNLYNDCSTAIDLRFPPLAECKTIRYIDPAGAEQELAAGTNFQVDFFSEPARVAPLPGRCWPATQCGKLNAVRIPYSAGYEPNPSVPASTSNQTLIVMNSESSTNADVNRVIFEDIVTAIKQIVLHWFVNRDVVIATPGAGGIFAPLPIHLDNILDQHRLMNLALTFPR